MAMDAINILQDAKSFTYHIKNGNYSNEVKYTIEIPLPEYIEPNHLLGNLMRLNNIPLVFYKGYFFTFVYLLLVLS